MHVSLLILVKARAFVGKWQDSRNQWLIGEADLLHYLVHHIHKGIKAVFHLGIGVSFEKDFLLGNSSFW